MNFFSIGILVSGILFFIVLIMLGGLIIFKSRRRKIIRMGHEATGTILEITEHWGRGGNKYYKQLIQYQTPAGNPVMLQHISMNKRRTYLKGETVPLYYNPQHPEKYLFKDDEYGKYVMRFFWIMAIFFLILAVCALLFLA